MTLFFGTIFVMLGIPTGGGRSDPNRGMRLQAKSTMKGVEIALLGFKTEYRKLPSIPTHTETEPTLTEGDWLIDLMGSKTGSNLRGIVFYEPPTAKKGKNGFVQEEGKPPRLLDLWGGPYRAHFDIDGDGTIPNPEKPTDTVNSHVILWSAGPDGNPTTWEDNVKSWK